MLGINASSSLEEAFGKNKMFLNQLGLVPFSALETRLASKFCFASLPCNLSGKRTGIVEHFEPLVMGCALCTAGSLKLGRPAFFFITTSSGPQDPDQDFFLNGNWLHFF